MLVYKCDRCGKLVEREDNYRVSIENCFFEDYIDYDLCEQCYTTIKEVLQDGEIK